MKCSVLKKGVVEQEEEGEEVDEEQENLITHRLFQLNQHLN